MTVQQATSSMPTTNASAPRPLNVLLVTDHLGHANGVIHGASRYYLNVLPRVDRSRFTINLCILRGHHPFAAMLEAEGIHPIFLNRSKWDPRALTDLLHLAQQLDVDVLHCLAMKGCLFGRLVGRATSTPALIHLHDMNRPGAIIGFLQRRLAPWTHSAIAVSDLVREYTISTLAVPPERVETLYNGLDVTAFAEPEAGARERIRGELGLPEDATVILLAGRVVETKGQRLLLKLLPRIRQQCPKARLLIVGEGPDLAECRRLAERLEIAEFVVMPGQRTDMPSIIAAADIAAVPSLQAEGFGYTALEAAAGGRPVVAFEGGAMREIIDDGHTGYVVAQGDSIGFADALIGLARDPALAEEMGLAGMDRAQRFGIDQHVRRLQQIYTQCAALHSGSGCRARSPGGLT